MIQTQTQIQIQTDRDKDTDTDTEPQIQTGTEIADQEAERPMKISSERLKPRLKLAETRYRG